MTRSTVRGLAILVLALLGAPVAMHVVMHDLRHHHDRSATVNVAGTDHVDHDHPIVVASAPQVSSPAPGALPITVTPAMPVATPIRTTTANRNVLSFGALRIDDDIGLHCLHAVFRI